MQPPKPAPKKKASSKPAKTAATTAVSEGSEPGKEELPGRGEPDVNAPGKDKGEKEEERATSDDSSAEKKENCKKDAVKKVPSGKDGRKETANGEVEKDRAKKSDPKQSAGEGTLKGKEETLECDQDKTGKSGRVKETDGEKAKTPEKGEGDIDEDKEMSPAVEERASDSPTVEKNEEEKRKEEERRKKDVKWRTRKVRIQILLLAVANLLPLLYFSLIHQRGTMAVMGFLHESAVQGIRKTPQESRNKNQAPLSAANAAARSDILFLMPCHSTPYYSHLHANVSMRFLTCEPNLDHVANYTDEADVFYLNPAEWLMQEYQKDATRKLPTHVVYFDALKESIEEFLILGGYKRCARFFHTHLPEGRVGSYVLVSCR
jgi:hypothetical protein